MTGPVPTSTPPLGYRELAWWPEIIDGNEGKDMVIALVTNPDRTTTAVLELEDDARTRGHEPILKGIKFTSTLPPKTRPVEHILVKVRDAVEPVPAKIKGVVCDAVFSTRSAMRKFVTLYYDTHHILDEVGRAKLNAAIDNADVIAIGHALSVSFCGHRWRPSVPQSQARGCRVRRDGLVDACRSLIAAVEPKSACP